MVMVSTDKHFPAEFGGVLEVLEGDAAVLGRVADRARVRWVAVRGQHSSGVLRGGGKIDKLVQYLLYRNIPLFMAVFGIPNCM